MIKKLFNALFLFLVCNACYCHSSLSYSEKLADIFTQEYGKLLPEKASFIGYPEYDSKVTKMTADFDQKNLSFLYRWLDKLKSINMESLNKNDRVDIQMLTEYIKDQIKIIEINHQEKVVPFIPGSQLILENLNALNKTQYSLARKKAVMQRFHEYVDSDFLLHAREYMLAAINKYSIRGAVYPYQKLVENYLNTSSEYVKTTQLLIEKFHEPAVKKDFVKYTKQVAKFDKFVRTKILPNSNKNPGVSPALYKVLLTLHGIESDSLSEMIQKGKQDYAMVYQKYQTLAEQIAKKYNLSDTSPIAVINFLKQNKITSPAEILKLYQRTSLELDNLIRKQNLVTLPNSPLKIRLAGITESKMHPAPRINTPPRHNPQGIEPVFVVPMGDKGLPYDDFTYPVIAVALLAHEGRPGHDLQYRSLQNQHINLIRSYYAKHSTETEGWALYAEDMIYPYVGLEEQFGILQLRLQRLARYFLDPLVQLNKITKDEVISILHNEVGLSKSFAEVEYKRYAYLLPGQAPSYYYGLLKIQELKTQLTAEYGNLNEKCFNDTLLSFGMIPIKYVYMFKEQFKHNCQIGEAHNKR